MFTKNKFIAFVGLSLLIAVVVFAKNNQPSQCVEPKNTQTITITHSSLGATRYFYKEYDQYFEDQWRCKTGQSVKILNTSGVSGEIKRDIQNQKISPDIVSLSNPSEMDAVAKAGLVDKNWQSRFPNNSSPFYSVVSFFVKRNNPKNIHDWNDLIQKKLDILVSDPVNCGGGRWVYAAVLNHANLIKNKDYIKLFYANVPKLYDNQGESEKKFVNDNIGDVLVTYESNLLTAKALGEINFDIITPPETVSIDMVVGINKNKINKITKAYIDGLYSKEAQIIAAKNFLRPRMNLDKEFLNFFPEVKITKLENTLQDSDIKY